MMMDNNWLEKQRVSGGYNFASALMLMNCHAKNYVEFFVKKVMRDFNVVLDVKESYEGLQIMSGIEIVWFGRYIDVDLLRTVRFGLFEEIVLGRLRNLKVIPIEMEER